MAADVKNLLIFITFTVVCLMFFFSFWFRNLIKLLFTNLANPKNPNLDCTDYGCEIRLVDNLNNMC